MKFLLAVLIVVAPLVSADRFGPDLDWWPTQQFTLDWATDVKFQACSASSQCPAGTTCSFYAPCASNQGWCDTCEPPYYRQVDANFNFVCALPSKLINAACTKRGECYSLSTCNLNGTLTCKCPLGTKANADSTVCINDFPNMVTIGGTCNVSTQCGNSAQCGADRAIAGNTNQCACYPGYKPATNNKDCVAMMPGDPCTATTLPNANCTGTPSMFQCNSGYEYINTFQTGDMWGDLFFGAQTGPACVPESAITNLGMNDACSSNQNQYCQPQLYCQPCTPTSSSVCQGVSAAPPTPLNQITTTPAPLRCSATSVMYTSLVIIGAALLAALLH